jgi:hypothetical protein
VPLKKKGFSIVNVDKAGKKGSHWVAVYNTGKTLYIYDSFGRPSTTLLKHLSSVARQRYNLKLVDSRLDAEQFGKKSQICGQLSLAWLVAVQTLGIRQAITI